MESRKEKRLKRHENDLMYLREFFPSNIKGIIIKIFASKSEGCNYEKITGKKLLEENTLILGDNDNNVLLVFQKEKDKRIITKKIASDIHIIEKFDYDFGSLIHKRREPSAIPSHLKEHLTFVNIQTSVTDNFDSLKISDDLSFFEKNYKKGGICSLSKMIRHDEWTDEYRNLVKTGKVHICKSCRKKWLKGCCEQYARDNRIQLVMVIDWHE